MELNKKVKIFRKSENTGHWHEIGRGIVLSLSFSKCSHDPIWANVLVEDTQDKKHPVYFEEFLPINSKMTKLL